MKTKKLESILKKKGIFCSLENEIIQYLDQAFQNDELTEVEKEEWIKSLLPEITTIKSKEKLQNIINEIKVLFLGPKEESLSSTPRTQRQPHISSEHSRKASVLSEFLSQYGIVNHSIDDDIQSYLSEILTEIPRALIVEYIEIKNLTQRNTPEFESIESFLELLGQYIEIFQSESTLVDLFLPFYDLLQNLKSSTPSSSSPSLSSSQTFSSAAKGVVSQVLSQPKQIDKPKSKRQSSSSLTTKNVDDVSEEAEDEDEEILNRLWMIRYLKLISKENDPSPSKHTPVTTISSSSSSSSVAAVEMRELWGRECSVLYDLIPEELREEETESEERNSEEKEEEEEEDDDDVYNEEEVEGTEEFDEDNRDDEEEEEEEGEEEERRERVHESSSPSKTSKSTSLFPSSFLNKKMDFGLLVYLYLVQCQKDSQATALLLLDLCQQEQERQSKQQSQQKKKMIQSTTTTKSHSIFSSYHQQRMNFLQKLINQHKKYLETTKKTQLHTIERFGELTLLPKYDQKGKLNALKSRPIALLPQHKKPPSDPKVRYLDGKIVSFKGEKIVRLPNPKSFSDENYDGGSRGRVKAKGKRGPGWTS